MCDTHGQTQRRTVNDFNEWAFPGACRQGNLTQRYVLLFSDRVQGLRAGRPVDDMDFTSREIAEMAVAAGSMSGDT